MNDIELRDHFAGLAAQGMLAHYGEATPHLLAEEAFKYAQDMVNEKNRIVKQESMNKRSDDER